MKQITAYKTDGGEIFERETDALNAEKRFRLERALEGWLFNGDRGEPFDWETVFNTVWNNRENLKNLL